LRSHDPYAVYEGLTGERRFDDVKLPRIQPLGRADCATGVRPALRAFELMGHAGLWPLGEAHVHIDLQPLGTTATQVTITENFGAGPLLFLRNKINDLDLHRRNIESLRRLADLAEHQKA
jgi:hypothetical protein